MTCMQGRPTDLDGMLAMIENCAISYGGPNWMSLAMMGLAVVIMAGLLLFTLFLLLRAIR